jgi:tRNA-dependent cyclodipeptide synthase
MSVAISLRVPGGEKSELQKSKGLFSISMGLDKILMHNECLKKTIAAIDATFDSCDVVVSDTLQRHNLMMKNPELSEEQAYVITSKIGDGWLSKNSHILSDFSIPYRVFRWSEWLQDSHYKEKQIFVEQLFRKDLGFRVAVAKAVRTYHERKSENSTLVLTDYLEAKFELAHHFVIEEAAVMLVWCDLGYDFELHTSNRSDALTYVHDVYYSNQELKKLRPARIKVLGTYNEVYQVV